MLLYWSFVMTTRISWVLEGYYRGSSAKGALLSNRVYCSFKQNILIQIATNDSDYFNKEKFLNINEVIIAQTVLWENHTCHFYSDIVLILFCYTLQDFISCLVMLIWSGHCSPLSWHCLTILCFWDSFRSSCHQSQFVTNSKLSLTPMYHRAMWALFMRAVKLN